MVKLIVGNKGSGKTKAIVGLVNEAAKSSHGNVVCIEKSQKLTYDVDYRVRLIDTDNYRISGYDMFYGFIAGLLAGNYDIKDLFVDTTLRIGGRDYTEFSAFVEKLVDLTQTSDLTITCTVSCDKNDLPESVHKYFTEY